MRILFDIYHLPQLNFFKPTLQQLGPEKVDICCVNRGRLVDVIRHDLPEYNLFVYGDYKYNTGFVSTVFRIILPRLYNLHKHVKDNRYSLVLSATYQALLVSWINNMPCIGFSDDPRRITYSLTKLCSNEFYIPSFAFNDKTVSRFNALKEWAYLAPDYFTPDAQVLEKFNIVPGEYIFIRDVSTKTLNYQAQSENIIPRLASEISDPVVLSLENKANRSLFPKHWLILEEPVSGIHSIMYYSKFIVSTGDSMAREGGMLGVNSIYLGERNMPANQMLIREGTLHKLTSKEFLNSYKGEPRKYTRTEKEKEQFRYYLNNKWDNVTNIILSLIYKYHTSGEGK